jgi:hypothetical protein
MFIKFHDFMKFHEIWFRHGILYNKNNKNTGLTLSRCAVRCHTREELPLYLRNELAL